ncbi:Integral inner nuclear membrane protein ima1 [Apiospora kogelbergensis]|uniref:Integral inner nuclear membrane protein ima1 n=1 Tax=Apiospora kogelbergensis TaxID=1337665 RepID=UPI00312F8C7F
MRRQPQHPQYATSFSSSFSSRPPAAHAASSSDGSAMDSIFCSTCLKNQHIYTEALRQFELPDDQNDPEYNDRVRAFRKWRGDLEQRYPQVCATCEPKVQQQLNKASYTAKTDHLRRVMDRTRARRREVKRRGVLDVLDSVGRVTWHVAFALEFCWHASVLCALFVQDDEVAKTTHWLVAPLRNTCYYALMFSPDADRYIRWSMTLGLASFAWNPRFKQTIRGFTAHILGVGQWYTYQLLILFIRLTCLFVSQYNESKGITAASQLGAHLVIGLLMFYVYTSSGRAIRLDTTPLFGSNKPVTLAPADEPQLSPQSRRDDMGSILDEILESPARPNKALQQQQPRPMLGSPLRYSVSTGGQQEPQSGGFELHPRRVQPASGLGSLRLDDEPVRSQPEPPVVQYGDEMDWSPSGSQHRAFNTHNPFKVKNPNPRFSDAPIEDKPGPFWYKIPPAPTTPAQRLRNPPMKPIIRDSPKDIPENFFSTTRRGPVDIVAPARNVEQSNMIFRESSFHAPEAKDEATERLSRMMGSFSLTPEPESHRAGAFRARAGVFSTPSHVSNEPLNNSRTRMAELLVLFGALWAWITALESQEEYAPTLALGAIIINLAMTVRLAVDLADSQIQQGENSSALALFLRKSCCVADFGGNGPVVEVIYG